MLPRPADDGACPARDARPLVSSTLDPASQSLVVICGPTATGKSAVAIALGTQVPAEIISADSRTIYHGMDIGTAKPSPEDRARVPHHLIDIAEPAEIFTLAQYQRLAVQAIAEIHQRKRLPLLVGGTGLYIRAVTDGLEIPKVQPHWELREQLEAEERRSPGSLHARLRALDPDAAGRVHPRNVRRIIRGLEVMAQTGRPISAQQRVQPVPWRVIRIGLRMPRRMLDERIERRVDEQIAAGLVEEVRQLLEAGVPKTVPAMEGLGYKEIVPYLEGRMPLGQAVAALKLNTRRYARRQETWFRPDSRIRWIDVGHAGPDTVAEIIRAMLAAANEE